MDATLGTQGIRPFGGFAVNGPNAVQRFWLLVALSIAVLAVVVARADSMPRTVTSRAPAGLFVNVKEYGARGDGKTDDTVAIQSAIASNVGDPRTRFLYFPAGVYLVSNRLEWRDTAGRWQPYLGLQGEDESKTVIKLRDHAAGYDDPENPRAVVYTASGLFTGTATSGGRDYPGLGEGGEAFKNFVFDLSVDTGSGNRGAIGIDFLANNVGAIRNVTVRSGDGSGVAGISMTRKWAGPSLGKNVTIRGFDYGISITNPEYSVTFEGLTLAGQRKAGIRNQGNVLSLRDVHSDNFVPLLHNAADDGGLAVIIDGVFEGGAPYTSAIENTHGEVYARNLVTSGYESAIESKGTVVKGGRIEEFSSAGAASTFGSNSGSLRLPVQETPEVPRDSWQAWVNVERFGAHGRTASGADDVEGDDTAGVQAAIDSGATTVYLPPGKYLFGDTVHIRGNVRRIDFGGAWLGPTSAAAFADGRPLFAFDDGTSEVVVLDQIGGYWNLRAPQPPSPMIEHRSERTLVIRDGIVDTYANEPGSGPLFIEDVSGTPWHFERQQVWARQFNPESNDDPMMLNNGGFLWVLGLKTEQPATVIETKGGGRTEVLGGLVYPTKAVAPDTAAFVNDESGQSLVYAVSSYAGGSNYDTQVESTRDGITQRIGRNDLPTRNRLGTLVPLLSDFPGQ